MESEGVVIDQPSLDETTSIFAVLHFVREAGRIACLPEAILLEGVSSGAFIRLPWNVGRGHGQLGIITRRGEAPSANAAGFIDILRSTNSLYR